MCTDVVHGGPDLAQGNVARKVEVAKEITNTLSRAPSQGLVVPSSTRAWFNAAHEEESSGTQLRKAWFMVDAHKVFVVMPGREGEREEEDQSKCPHRLFFFLVSPS